jgi:hypothetical protein
MEKVSGWVVVTGSGDRVIGAWPSYTEDRAWERLSAMRTTLAQGFTVKQMELDAWEFKQVRSNGITVDMGV